MAKKQSFGDKVRRGQMESRKMAKVIVATKKPNGHYSFQERIVDADRVKNVIEEAKSSH
jgi:hypothetical protein